MRSNYTTSFSAVDDRFEFSRKGIFLCRKKHEAMIIMLYSLAIAAVTAIIWSVSIFAEANAASVIYTLVFDALKIVSVFAAPLFLIGGIRVIRSGETYNYKADSVKMLITCPKADHRADIFYERLISVDYKPRTSFSGKITGFDVNVNCTDGIFFYRFLFPTEVKIRHPDMTPFRMLEEQAGLLEKPEYLAGKRIDNAGFLG